MAGDLFAFSFALLFVAFFGLLSEDASESKGRAFVFRRAFGFFYNTRKFYSRDRQRKISFRLFVRRNISVGHGDVQTFLRQFDIFFFHRDDTADGGIVGFHIIDAVFRVRGENIVGLFHVDAEKAEKFTQLWKGVPNLCTEIAASRTVTKRIVFVMLLRFLRVCRENIAAFLNCFHSISHLPRSSLFSAAFPFSPLFPAVKKARLPVRAALRGFLISNLPI